MKNFILRVLGWFIGLRGIREAITKIVRISLSTVADEISEKVLSKFFTVAVAT